MEKHYNAFISYRHAPADSMIAGMLQRKLEHYRIPKKIQEQTGISKIRQIFRDKEELPITSNLNDDISQALANSDFLIVICSTSTKESAWVEKEIETFLKTHSRQNVLTVLVDGEPYEVIPPILLTEQVTVSSPDGTQSVKTVALEPLSCDMRGNPKRALKTELHRLAAGLLQCPYDELYQRQRKYRQRRLTAVLSAVILGLSILAGYFLWSSIQIQANYLRAEENFRQAQINQSQFLAAESQTLQKNGDRITAIQLALEALPSVERSRPLVPEAEYALSQALHIYSSDRQPHESVNVFSHDGNVVSFFPSGHGTRLWVRDSIGNLYLWDTEEKTLLKEWYRNGSELQDFFSITLIPVSEERIAIASSSRIRCMDSRNGETLWEQEIANRTGTVHMESDGKLLAGLSQENAIFCLDVETGTLLLETPPCPSEDTGAKETVTSAALSPDGNIAAFTRYTTSGNMMDLRDAQCQVVLFSRDTDTWQTLEVPGQEIGWVSFSPEGDLYVISRVWKDGNTLNESALFSDVDAKSYSVLYWQSMLLSCIDPRTAQLRWSNEVEYFELTSEPKPVFLQYAQDNGTNADAVCFTVANKTFLYSCADGSVLDYFELPAWILNVKPQADQISWILGNGRWATYIFGKDGVSTRHDFPDNLSGAELSGEKLFTVSFEGDQKDIVMYDTIPADEAWVPFADASAMNTCQSSAVIGSHFLLLLKDSASRWQLQAYDLETKALRCTAALPDADGDVAILGIAPDGSVLLAQTFSTGGSLLQISLSDGSVKQTAFPADERYQNTAYRPDTNQVLLLAHEALTTVTPGTEPIRTPLAFDQCSASYLEKSVSAHQGDQFLGRFKLTLASGETQTVLCLVNASGKITLLPEDLQPDSDFQAVFSPDDQCIAILGTDSIPVLTTDGNQICAIPLNGRRVYSASFLGDGESFAVLFSGNELCRYSLPDGKLLQKTTIPGTTLYTYVWDRIQWERISGNDLLIRFAWNGMNSVVLDPVNWSTRAVVDDCLAYDPAADSFLTARSFDGAEYPGLIHRRSIEELTSQARQLLNGKTLTEVQRKIYGLS